MWMFRGVMGRDFDGAGLHNIKGEQWNGSAVYLRSLDMEQKKQVLNGSHTLRVAVWRDPYERLLSAWKSKFSCDNKRYGSDYEDRMRIVPQLSKLVGLKTETCMNISQYAHTLDVLRDKLISKDIDVSAVNSHIRPAHYLFDVIKYDLLLDVRDISRPDKVERIVERFRYKDGMLGGAPRLHASTGGDVEIGKEDAEKIAKFADLTLGPLAL